MSAAFSIGLSTAHARSWAEQMAKCLRSLPDGDARRGEMIRKVDAALRQKTLFCVDRVDHCAVMAPTTYARGLLIEARTWA